MKFPIYIYIYTRKKKIQMFQTTKQQSIGMLPKITAWVLRVYVSSCHSFFGIAIGFFNHPGSKYRTGHFDETVDLNHS